VVLHLGHEAIDRNEKERGGPELTVVKKKTNKLSQLGVMWGGGGFRFDRKRKDSKKALSDHNQNLWV